MNFLKNKFSLAPMCLMRNIQRERARGKGTFVTITGHFSNILGHFCNGHRELPWGALVTCEGNFCNEVRHFGNVKRELS